MATRTNTKSTASTKAAVLEDETAEAETAAEVTPKQLINEAIGRVVEAHGIDVQKNRYKAMRAIAYQAFVNSINDGTFDALVDEAISNVDSLPSGWEIEKPAVAEAPVKATPAKKAPAKTPAKSVAKAATPAKPAARRRPTR